MQKAQQLLDSLAEKALSSILPTREEAQRVLDLDDSDVLLALDRAFRVRRRFFGKRVKLNMLLNIQSGLCAEDCHYCSQAKGSTANIAKYPLLPKKEFLNAAGRAVELKASRLCLVASGRGPSDREVRKVGEAVAAVRDQFPQLEICTCLGLLSDAQATHLKNSGVFAYNHNVNTSDAFYSEICSTHTFADRVDTIRAVKRAQLSPCSGVLLGMGESDDDILDAAFALREIRVDSVPINFLIPIPGTPLEHEWQLTPFRCLKILCMFRFIHPDAEIRIAGGREVHLRSLQPLALFAANSMFIGDYLTTKGQLHEDDYQMLLDGQWEIEGQETAEPMNRDIASLVKSDKTDYVMRTER